MDFVTELLCIVQSFLDELFGLINGTLGDLFGFQITSPDLGVDCPE